MMNALKPTRPTGKARNNRPRLPLIKTHVPRRLLAMKRDPETVKPGQPGKSALPNVQPAEPAPLESLRGDSLQLYLREIGQVKLITPKE